MPLTDAGYFLPSAGGTMVYTADIDTPAPADLGTPGADWNVVGHVGDESGDGDPAFTRDGGDVTTKGSMSKRAIRTITEAVTTGVEMDFTQFTRDVLALYHGTDGGTTDGEFAVGANDDGSTETALLIVWRDGNIAVGLYAPRVSWTGRDNIDTDSVEDAIKIPMAASFLDSPTQTAATGNPLRYKWISPVLLEIPDES